MLIWANVCSWCSWTRGWWRERASATRGRGCSILGSRPNGVLGDTVCPNVQGWVVRINRVHPVTDVLGKHSGQVSPQPAPWMNIVCLDVFGRICSLLFSPWSGFNNSARAPEQFWTRISNRWHCHLRLMWRCHLLEIQVHNKLILVIWASNLGQMNCSRWTGSFPWQRSAFLNNILKVHRPAQLWCLWRDSYQGECKKTRQNSHWCN
jgi:hypothetical protein